MLLGIRSLWRTNRRAVMPYLLIILIFPITYYLTHPMMDYRQPLEPAVVVLGVAGALSLRHAEARKPAATASRDLASETR
jgi:hypothetical protein